MSLFKVGLETHISLNTPTKLYCDCKPQESSCVICTARPGFFPIKISSEALTKAVTLARILESEVAQDLVMCRKHYSYYDLLAGYQLSQGPNEPLAKNGFLRTLEDEIVEIDKILLEEDPAAATGANIDVRRSGSCLIELVTKPVFCGSIDQITDKIKKYLKTLSVLLLQLDLVNKKKMMKTDVNISLQGESYRYEIKNLDSLTKIKKALKEAAKILQADPEPINLTYSYKKDLIRSRIKQEYLYIREPNLLPISLNKYLNTEIPLTLYELRNLTKNYFLNLCVKPKDQYIFLKNLMRLIKSNNLKRDALEDLLKGTYAEASYKIRNYDLLGNNARIESILKEIIVEKDIKLENYLTKDHLFISCMKALKANLLDKKIKFNSEIIGQIFKKIYNPQ